MEHPSFFINLTFETVVSETAISKISTYKSGHYEILWKKRRNKRAARLSKVRPLTLVIDEFQDFKRVNPSVFSDMQKIWDLNKQDSRINLVVCGFVYSLMNIIFKNNK